MKAAHWAKLILALVVLALLLFGRKLLNFWAEWLWFGSLGYESVYTTRLLTKVVVGVVVGVVFFALVYGNLVLARKLSPGALKEMGTNVIYLRARPYLERYLYAVLGAVVLVFAFGVGRTAAEQWTSALRFLHGQPFGTTDPIFGKDLSFFIFKWPFLRWMFQQLTLALVLAFVGSLGLYLVSSAIRILNRKLHVAPAARAHGAMLLALLFFTRAWGYALQAYGIVVQEHANRPVVCGAGYTDIHATLLALRLLMALAAVGGVLLLVCVRINALKPIAYTVGAMVVVSVLAGNAFPWAVQSYLVEPNELDRERPYLEHAIKFTREAYGLEKARARPYKAAQQLTPEDLTNNRVTLHSIRLWDHRPLRATYRQVQEIRTYYEFLDVDIDRYTIGDEYRQVTLSARELSHEKLADTAKTWINQRLKYTHGYGVCLSPVNEVDNEGLPRLFVKDIPPVSDVGSGLNIERPEIYYGEAQGDYCLVKTQEAEFDYPKGNDNVGCQYEGEGGVPIGSFGRRLAFAMKLGDLKLLVTRQLRADSRIMLRRNLKERVLELAPFLRFDHDPYIVIADGRLCWVVDAYTVASRYPYSEPFDRGGVNYIRNSVKVLIDPYHGTTTFYVVDRDDPVLKTYQRIFPKLFTDGAEMPEAIRAHLRCPLDLFGIQAHKYATYHMTNPETFYNKEDLWDLPKEVFEADRKRGQTPELMSPYYIIMKLPGEAREEFVLMIPFVPSTKDNMIAWMCARCDPEHYGELVVFNFPKDKLIYGPMQIEARVDQNTRISEQLTLWSQKGSRVIRGNLLVIPIEDSLIYVEPLYLQAEIGEMPELKQVIAAFKEKVVMADTLEGALGLLFGIEQSASADTPHGVALMPAELGELVDRADALLSSAQRNAARDWSGFARDMGRLEETLGELKALTGETKTETETETETAPVEE